MAFDDFLAERINNQLIERKVNFYPKKMFGGVCFMVNDKMCLGVIKNDLMARIDPELYQQKLEENGAQEMNFTGKPMKGFILVKPEGIDLDKDLAKWVDLCLAYNPKAKQAKKKKTKNYGSS